MSCKGDVIVQIKSWRSSPSHLIFRKFLLCSSRLAQSFEQQCRRIYSLEVDGGDHAIQLHDCGLDFSDQFRSQLRILMNDLDVTAQSISESKPVKYEETLHELEGQFERISQMEKYWHLCEISQFHGPMFVSLEFAKWLKVNIFITKDYFTWLYY